MRWTGRFLANHSAAIATRATFWEELRESRRTGLTLLEIVLALVIFSAAMATLSQLAWNGSRATVQGRLKTLATIRCEAMLNEVLAGAHPMQNTSSVPFADDSHWAWSLTVIPSPYPELVQMEMTVRHRSASRLASVDVSLRRWARLQSFFAKAVTEVKEEAEKKANLEPGKTSSSSGSQ